MKKQHLLALYLIGLFVILGIKYGYSRAGFGELDFILAPTARWVTFLSGINFNRQVDVGYINHSIRFIIAPSCSGVQFMLITFSALFFPLVHRMNSVKKGVCWFAGSFLSSFPFTVFVNGIRIVLSIYIPVYFNKWNIYANWLTAQRLHTIIGTVVYVTALLALYHLAGLVSSSTVKISSDVHGIFPSKVVSKIVNRIVPPILCYFFIVLIIPLIHNARQNDLEKFLEYASLITSVCFALILLYCIVYTVQDHLSGKQ
ncbi:exosortase K [Lacrimispora sp.]|uniref:exosortase K n=1 Tax=Lacrimispora sp. TaxID=2719234 RepID=UPI0032E52B60